MDIDTWKNDLRRAAGIITGVEALHPNNHELEQAAQPFLDYVNGLADDPETGSGGLPIDVT